jgi:hypothetical protein
MNEFYITTRDLIDKSRNDFDRLDYQLGEINHAIDEGDWSAADNSMRMCLVYLNSMYDVAGRLINKIKPKATIQRPNPISFEVNVPQDYEELLAFVDYYMDNTIDNYEVQLNELNADEYETEMERIRSLEIDIDKISSLLIELPASELSSTLREAKRKRKSKQITEIYNDIYSATSDMEDRISIMIEIFRIARDAIKDPNIGL